MTKSPHYICSTTWGENDQITILHLLHKQGENDQITILHLLHTQGENDQITILHLLHHMRRK